MEDKNEEDFLKLLGAKGTKQILEFLGRNSTAQYRQLMDFVNTPTLNTRLRDLLLFGIVSHHLERVETRREWYELTEKGKQVLQVLQELLELIKEPL